MSRCKICGCDLGHFGIAHNSPSCQPQLVTCYECGEEDRATNMQRCYICEADLCSECLEEHVKLCEQDNGQFGVGA